MGAVRDAGILVAFTEIPQADLVEIVEPDCPGNTVNETGIGHGYRNDVG